MLHARAREATGLDDFGPDDYRERLDLYVSELRGIDMHGPGIVNFHAQLAQWLKNRLLLTDLLTRHPEIEDLDLDSARGHRRPAPVRHHPPAQSVGRGPHVSEPALLGGRRAVPAGAERASSPIRGSGEMDVAVQTMDLLMPHFALMHEMTTDHVHEEIQLLANDFSTMLMDTLAHVPRWTDYYWSRDQTSSYRYLVTQLKALQFLRGGRRWVLKSPQHLGQLPVLDDVMPGVVVVFTHRDPVPVAFSMIAMITYSERMHRDTVDVGTIAATGWTAWNDSSARVSGTGMSYLQDRSVDIRFDDFMADEIGVAEAVYRVADESFSGDVHSAVAEYLQAHRRGRHGRVHTSAQMFGLDPDELRERFAPYSARFLTEKA